MASLSPEEQVSFLLACLKHTDATPDFAAVAVECGIEKRPAARKRYKAIVEHQTSYFLNGENRIEMKDDGPLSATPKTTAAGATTNSDEATPAETPSTTSPKKRGRPKKNAGDGDQTETPAKKPRKPRQTKKEMQNGGAEDDEGIVQAQIESSTIGNSSDGKVDDLGTHTNGNIDED